MRGVVPPPRGGGTCPRWWWSDSSQLPLACASSGSLESCTTSHVPSRRWPFKVHAGAGLRLRPRCLELRSGTGPPSSPSTNVSSAAEPKEPNPTSAPGRPRWRLSGRRCHGCSVQPRFRGAPESLSSVRATEAIGVGTTCFRPCCRPADVSALTCPGAANLLSRLMGLCIGAQRRSPSAPNVNRFLTALVFTGEAAKGAPTRAPASPSPGVASPAFAPTVLARTPVSRAAAVGTKAPPTAA